MEKYQMDGTYKNWVEEFCVIRFVSYPVPFPMENLFSKFRVHYWHTPRSHLTQNSSQELRLINGTSAGSLDLREI